MILVFDLGTTYFKFALVDQGGQIVDLCRIEPPVRRGQPDIMELDASAFAAVVAEGVAQLKASSPDAWSNVSGVTFSTQTNSFVLLDASGRPLTPIILWPDGRAADFEEEFRRCCDLPAFTLTTGIPAVSRQFMAAKLLWLRRESPPTWRRAAKICLISDYLTILLTGRHVTEAGAAGLTGLLDIHGCRWWPEILARLDMPIEMFPQVVRAGCDLGPIGSAAGDVSARFDLLSGSRFVVGCLDQYAGAMGVGNVLPGFMSETTGTVLSTVRCTDRFASAPPGVFQGPAFADGLYYQMAFGEVSANYLEWYRNQLSDRPDFERLAALAGLVERADDGLRLRTDVALTSGNAATSVGEVFEGLTHAHTRGHLVRCIMETVGLALREQATALSGSCLPSEIRSAGGGARSDVWLQIKADVLSIPVRATQCTEPACLGAAMLAEAALRGLDVREIARRWVRLKPPFLPVRDGVDLRREPARPCFP